MSKLAAFVGALLIALISYFLWWNRLPPFDGHGEPVPVAITDVLASMEEVQVQGTAHLPIRISRTWPPGFLRKERVLFFFPLFEKKDITSKKIHLMVATDTPPDRLVSFEDMTVAGWARPPAARMDAASEQAFIDVGYTFAEEYVLIETFVPQ